MALNFANMAAGGERYDEFDLDNFCQENKLNDATKQILLKEELTTKEALLELASEESPCHQFGLKTGQRLFLVKALKNLRVSRMKAENTIQPMDPVHSTAQAGRPMLSSTYYLALKCHTK